MKIVAESNEQQGYKKEVEQDVALVEKQVVAQAWIVYLRIYKKQLRIPGCNFIIFHIEGKHCHRKPNAASESLLITPASISLFIIQNRTDSAGLPALTGAITGEPKQTPEQRH